MQANARHDLCSLERGILHPANRNKRGKEWQRQADVQLFANGQEVLRYDQAGIRVHGGYTRKLVNPSLRIYFDKTNAPKRSVFWPHEQNKLTPQTIDRVIVRRAPEFYNEVAMQIAKNLGANVASFAPANVFINKRYWGTYAVTERMKGKHWRKRLKLDKDFFYFQFKDDDRSSESYQAMMQLKNWLLSTTSLSMTAVARHVDMNNFIAHSLSIIYSGTTDWRQGAMIRARDDTAQWQFINWDMDQSFQDIHVCNSGAVRPAYIQEGFDLLMTGKKAFKATPSLRPFRKWDVRELMFYRLWLESPIFRKKLTDYTRSFLHLLEDQGSASHPRRIIARYRSFAEKYASENSRTTKALDRMERFIERRSEFLYRQLDELNKLPLQRWDADLATNGGSLNKSHALLQLFRRVQKHYLGQIGFIQYIRLRNEIMQFCQERDEKRAVSCGVPF